MLILKKSHVNLYVSRISQSSEGRNRTLANEKIKAAAALVAVTRMELAEELGVALSSLSRALREELPEHRAAEMLDAIRRIESAPGRQEKLRRREQGFTEWTPPWEPVRVITWARRSPVEMGHNPTAARPFCVQYRGGGHYFGTEAEALAYCAGRRWISAADAGLLAERRLPGPEWREVKVLSARKGRTVRLLKREDADRPFAVQVGGYRGVFHTVGAACAFAYGRRWVDRVDDADDEEVSR